jgi:hypothetical protein
VDLAAKLQLKSGQILQCVQRPTTVDLGITTQATARGADALLVFVVTRTELERHRPVIAASALEDHLTWVAYPKSGQLGTDLNRDSLKDLLRVSGIDPVRQIAIDDTWSALRFRSA